MESILIIHKSFWPENDVIGAALYDIANKLNEHSKVSIITSVRNPINRNVFKNKEIDYNALLVKNSNNRIYSIIKFAIYTVMHMMRLSPNKIYITSNPPVLIPFLVNLYCKVFNVKFLYHCQDIHPEISKDYLNSYFYRFLFFLDKKTMKNSDKIITLTKEMKQYIHSARGVEIDRIELIANGVPKSKARKEYIKRKNGILYLGNLGRYQRMPLLLDSIEEYCLRGGELSFVFAGFGVYEKSFIELTKKFKNLSYLGYLTLEEANELMSCYNWCLLPVDDRALQFSFPSKSSAYAINQLNILGVSMPNSILENWISNVNGLNIFPDKQKLINAFFRIESGSLCPFKKDYDINHFSIDCHVNKLYQAIIDT
jgi:glycosyltransferase involved in cell wall biosynthesis